MASRGRYDDDHYGNDEDGDGYYAQEGHQGFHDGERYGGADHGAQSYRSHDDTQTYGPDILQLNNLCANALAPRSNTEDARLEADESWEPVREWLRTHTADEVRQAADQRGESSMTALHFSCRNQPPTDVINVLLSIAVETAQWPDTFGWLAIHYACACGADTAVIKALADSYPESKTTVDRRGRTPLHFALGNQNPDQLAAPAVVAILSSSGAASYADDNGMLVSGFDREGCFAAVYRDATLVVLANMIMLVCQIAAPALCLCVWCV
jgi:Ankyrin repeats (3 copies)